MDIELLIIGHKHGNNYYVCANKNIAQHILHEYVLEYWDRAFFDDNIEIPNTPEETIDLYFDENYKGEWYEIESTEVIFTTEYVT